jgi:alanine racemase
MSTTVTIGYADGSPLETDAQVDLLVNGKPVATANPNDAGQLIFNVDVPANSKLAVRFHPPSN